MGEQYEIIEEALESFAKTSEDVKNFWEEMKQNIMNKKRMMLIRTSQLHVAKKRRNVDYNSQDEYTTPKKRALADDKSYAPSGTNDSVAMNPDEECGSKLNVEEIGFDEFIDQEDKPEYIAYFLLQVDDYSGMQIKTVSRDTLEDLRKDTRTRIFGKEKISKEFKSTFQEYVETVLDGN
ncbi:3710_t:CDS:2 [Paraglomus brasilianum]|uniref:3710_t:CDS:1 n=1 Tax=Paraglomus brasilianum TaxID=144538 RepID=A0A9N9DH47_9GLOM|nr:3710_t:CDS:2 [Paraglomus brasilianum]